jgi:hypothetical protein
VQPATDAEQRRALAPAHVAGRERERERRRQRGRAGVAERLEGREVARGVELEALEEEAPVGAADLVR